MHNRFVLCPFVLGEPARGLRDLAADDWWVLDPRPDSAGLEETRIAVHEKLAQAVHRCLDRRGRPVSVAGDCCTTLAMLAGLRRAGIEPSLIWFDAHGDFNTPQTSPSGFLGGMPLAMLVGRGDPSYRRALDLEPLPEERVVLTDARDLDPGERRSLESSAVHHLRCVEEVLDRPLPDRPLWVHFDADVVDPRESPGHRYLVGGGPSAATLGRVFSTIARSGLLAAVSVSSWDPELDTTGESRRVTMELLDLLIEGA